MSNKSIFVVATCSKACEVARELSKIWGCKVESGEYATYFHVNDPVKWDKLNDVESGLS